MRANIGSRGQRFFHFLATVRTILALNALNRFHPWRVHALSFLGLTHL